MKKIWIMTIILVVLGAGSLLSMWVHVSAVTPSRAQNLPPPSDMPLPPELMGGAAPVSTPPPGAKPSVPAQNQIPSQAPRPAQLQQTGGAAAHPVATPAGLVEPQIPGLGEGQLAPGQHLTPQQLDPSIKFTSGEGFFYDPTGRRDPFKPFLSKPVEIKMTEQKTQPQHQVAPEPSAPPPMPFAVTIPEGESIVSHDLSMIKLVGILWDVREPKAMVRTPPGKVYMLRRHSKIGRSNGYVAAIREGEIVVVELSQDGKTPSTKVISLQK